MTLKHIYPLLIILTILLASTKPVSYNYGFPTIGILSNLDFLLSQVQGMIIPNSDTTYFDSEGEPTLF